MPAIDPRVAGLLNGQPMYGTSGWVPNQWQPGGNAGDFSDPNSLPDWLKNQYEFVDQSEGGNGYWRLKDVLKDQQGQAVHQIGPNNSDEGVIDFNQTHYDPSLGLLTSPQNVQQKERGGSMEKIGKGLLAAAAMYVTGGAAGLYGAPGAAAGSGLGAVEAGGSAGLGTGASGTAAFDLGGAAGAGAGAGSSVGGGSSAPVSGGGFGNTPQGVFAPGMENAAQADSWLINNGMSGMAGGNMTGLLGGGVGDMAGNVGSWAMKNPLQAYGLIQTAGGLIGGRGGNSGSPGSSGGGSKGGNGTGVSTKLDRPQFQPNPYLLAQIQRGGYQYP